MIYVLIIAAAGWVHPVEYHFSTLAECQQTKAAFWKEAGAYADAMAVCLPLPPPLPGDKK